MRSRRPALRSALWRIEMSPRRRQPRRPTRALRYQRLVDPDRPALEGERAAREVEEPQARRFRPDLGLGFRAMRIQVLPPQPGGAPVVLAPGLDVVHLEAEALEIRDRHAEMIELPAREDVARQRPVFGLELAEGAIRALRAA